jgi:predicted small lipoprotein YifL
MTGRTALRGAAILAVLVAAGCGQKGALYLPEATGEVVTRPTQTPSETPPAGEGAPAADDDAPPRAPAPR